MTSTFLSCCTFWNLCPCTTLLYFSLYKVCHFFSVLLLFFFFLSYILDIRSLFFSTLIPFSQLYSFFHILHTIPLSFLLFLFLLFFSSMLLGISHTTCSLFVFQGEILVLDFCRSISPLPLYPLQSTYIATISSVIYSLSSRNASYKTILHLS